MLAGKLKLLPAAPFGASSIKGARVPYPSASKAGSVEHQSAPLAHCPPLRYCPAEDPDLRKKAAWVVISVAVAGSMAGDVFKFRDTRGTLTGEPTVSGDEMTGKGMVGDNRQGVLCLRRVDSGASPPR